MDIKCSVCNEPWDAYGARHGDMAKWEYALFREGAGCPSCEGVTPEGADSEALAYAAAKGQVFDGTDDDGLVDNFVAVAGGLGRPEWKRPADPVVWSCEGCDAHVVRDLDTGDLEWRELGKGLYNLPHNVDRHDPPESAPYTVDGKGYCGCCASECSDCDKHVFNSDTSTNGTQLYGDTYDPGASFPHPLNYHSTVCVDCLEAIPSCPDCGEHYEDDEDAEACCAREPEPDEDDEDDED